MNVDVVKAIRNAEAEAKEIIKNANAQSKRIISEAEDEAFKLGISIAEYADIQANETEAKAKQNAEPVVTEIEKENLLSVEAVKEMSKNKIDKAVDFVIERIVG